jgi:spore maturation protein SpmA
MHNNENILESEKMSIERALWLYGFMALWLYGFMALWLYEDA